MGGADDLSTQLKRPRLQKGFGIAYLNINSIRNKFELLKPIILNTVDILVIAETKLDNKFATSPFRLEGFNPPYRYDSKIYEKYDHVRPCVSPFPAPTNVVQLWGPLINDGRSLPADLSSDRYTS